jgi:hypothetical protein
MGVSLTDFRGNSYAVLANWCYDAGMNKIMDRLCRSKIMKALDLMPKDEAERRRMIWQTNITAAIALGILVWSLLTNH